VAKFQNPRGVSASSTDAQNLKFERPDWTSFRTLEGLQQKSGVSLDKLIRLVLKELADNALDTGAEVTVGEYGGGYFVEDNGPGIDPDEVARLFSIGRPLASTKMLRLPTRGALGNGLRVAAGAVLASGGTLAVTSRGVRLELQPQRDGTTAVVERSASKRQMGTRIEISFGPALPQDKNALGLTKDAILMAEGTSYAGGSSPWWYDAPHFHELLSAYDGPVRALVAKLDGCAGGRAGEIVAACGLERRSCRDVGRDQATRLLRMARAEAKPVNPKRLGGVGRNVFAMAYAMAYGEASFGAAEPHAVIPFVVEAWAKAADKNSASLFVNRTPVAAPLRLYHDKTNVELFGCGLAHKIATAPKAKSFSVWLNITSPYVPITSDGKEPNLKSFVDAIADAVGKALRKVSRPEAKGRTQKDVVLDHLDEVIDLVSGGPLRYRFNERQLLYRMRPIVLREIGQTLTRGNFSGIITDYEAEHGEIPLMYREPRGSITHPHSGETFTLGTLMVEGYQRPVWSFNKLLYIEKEGAQEALKQNRWMERHDCAVMSSKGFSTRAARDLIDKLAAHDEDCEVFCAHDADGSGTVIYQTLQEATKARSARKIKIINIGLEPWEALRIGLEVETISRLTNKEGKVIRRPVAEYVKNHDGRNPDGTPNLDAAGNDISGVDWDEWLQTHRVELNAMTTPQLIDWLDGKMEKHGGGKLIPPETVLVDELTTETKKRLTRQITARILREAGLEMQVNAALAALDLPDGERLAEEIAAMFNGDPETSWRTHIANVADGLT
jgi:Histidine kinase-, DNA gyrase B-, and HSP90-like ATPase